MTPRERVFEAIHHNAPDRVPVTNRFTPEIADQLAGIVDLEGADTVDLEVALGHDMLCTKEIGISNTYKPECNEKTGDEYVDEFGIVKKRIPYEGGSYLEMVKHPLEELDAWSSYSFPDPNEQVHLARQFGEFEQAIARYGKTHAIVGGVTCTMLEGAEMLRGMSTILMDMYENPEFVHELLDKLKHYHFEVGKKLIELGVDILYIGDDVGTQQNMLLSPELWRTFLKPRYDELFRRWKEVRGDIVFAFHTDGHVEPIIPDFVEIGLDILNPVQPACMDDRKLKREFGDKLTFWGGINVQRTIPFGSAADVVAEVRDRMRVFGSGGGFIISPAHNVQPNVRSIDNTLAYYWACRQYGEYRGNEPAA